MATQKKKSASKTKPEKTSAPKGKSAGREGVSKTRTSNRKTRILVGMGTCGRAAGALKVYDLLSDLIKRNKVDAEVTQTGCIGMCSQEVLIDVQLQGRTRVLYGNLSPVKDGYRQVIEKIVEDHLMNGRVCKEHAFAQIKPVNGEQPYDGIPFYEDLSFNSAQERIVLRNCGSMDPESIDEYITRDGYRALTRVLKEMTPEGVVDEVKRSGLRGRGGAGFPTGLKWGFAAMAKGDVKYMICNADEGDPGAFMDRSVLEGDPHSVLEGMVIGGYAMGAHTGYIYVRAEYPLAVKRLKIAIAQAEERGFLGRNILGSGFDFEIHIKQGAGAFVCGEETALIASIEGKRGMPRPKPPFPANHGLWGKPTNINNVETLANIAPIILRGGEWYAGFGAEKSKGTKVFALAGKINKPGLIEVPMGTSLRSIIYDIGGGCPQGKKFKAVQTGGPSGGCIPASLIDTSVDYESLVKLGTIMGSGGMVIMDEGTCMVEMARYFLHFTQDESCGKCVPCRIGTKRMLEILERIVNGKGEAGDVDLLKDLGEDIKAASLCGLGRTAPNPVLSTIRYFQDEYEAHIKYKRCPSFVCKEIISSACQHTCPIGTEASVYTALIAHGRFEEAVQIIRKDNPLASVCARVCHHPCELTCKAGEGGGKPIAIRALKRFAMDYARKKKIKAQIPRKELKNQKAAVIGSGPAGLTAGYFLALKGYDVTIFEAKTVVGGMLRIAIPEYRLPKEVFGLDLAFMEDAGVKFKTGAALGKDISIDSLFEEGYKAIFIAIGSHQSMKLGIPGEETQGMIPSLRFLEAANTGRKIEIGKRVVVLGGGNSAVDSARTAHRIKGTEKIALLYRRTRSEMPAYTEEIEAALEEGVEMQFLTAPVKALSRNGKVCGLECVRMKLGELDKSGRARPVPIEGSEFVVDADTVIVAIGEQPDTSSIHERDGLEVSQRNTLVADPETLATSREGVFAGGDVVTGSNTVIHAMQAGRKAAESMDQYLKGESLEKRYDVTRPSRYIEPVSLTVEEIMEADRPPMPLLPVEKRKNNFREVELGFAEETAVKEAKRCLRCELSTLDGQKPFRK